MSDLKPANPELAKEWREAEARRREIYARGRTLAEGVALLIAAGERATGPWL
jgi:hypothetical protein